MLKKLGLRFILPLTIKFLAVFVGLFTTREIIAQLSPDDYVQFGLAATLVTITNSAIDFGLPVLIQKKYTNAKQGEDLSSFWATVNTIRFGTFFVGLLIILGTLLFYPISNPLLVFGLYFANFFLVLDLNYRAVSDASGASWKYTLTDLVGKICILGLLSSYQFTAAGKVDLITYVVTIFAIGFALTYLIDLIVFHKLAKWGVVNFKQLAKERSNILYLALTNLSIALFLNLDKPLLKFFKFDDLQIGGYLTAYRLLDILFIIPGILMPIASTQLKLKLDSNQVYLLNRFGFLKLSTSKKVFLEWFGSVAIFSAFITSAVIFLASFLSRIIDTENKYPDTAGYLQILILSLAFASICNLLSNLTVFMGGEKYELVSMMITTISAISLYLILIPQYGAVGASISTLLSYVILTGAKIFFFGRTFQAYKLTKPQT